MRTTGAPHGADIINTALTSIEQKVVAIASETGTTFEWELDSFNRGVTSRIQDPSRKTTMADIGLSVFLTKQTISVSKVKGHWALRYSRSDLAVKSRNSSPVPLRDAPMSVRSSFLEQAKDFRQDFQKAIADRQASVTLARSQDQETIAKAQELATTALAQFDDI